MLTNSVVGVLLAATCVVALGQQSVISFSAVPDGFQLAGSSHARPQIRVAANEYWGVVRAAGDLAKDFGRVTGTNFTLSNGAVGARSAAYEYRPAASNYTVYSTNGTSYFYGPNYTDPAPAETVIIAGTLGRSDLIDQLVSKGKLEVSKINGTWESFVSTIVHDPLPGVSRAVVIAGSDARGTIFGLYDLSEQIGVSPWYWWADVAVKPRKEIWFLPGVRVQNAPTVKYRGFFLNDEQPALSGWVSWNYPDTLYGVGFGPNFYAKIFEVLLRLRANYLWPTVWGSMFEVDDPANQPLADAFEVVLGSSHTEPLQRAQNEFGNFYTNQGLGPWAYNLNNKTIDDYFAYGAQRAKPYARNSLFTMGMRGTGDTALEGGLGTQAIVKMLEILVGNQRSIISQTLGQDIREVPQSWCLYKEVASYLVAGLQIPEDITLLWADDNWGNIRRVPVSNETQRSGGAGVYYHFDYVGDTRDYKWINTIQLEKTAEQMHLAYAHGADRIWIVNVGDMKGLEIPISHFFDMAYDAKKWTVDSVGSWTEAWATREFGADHASKIGDIMTRYGMYAGRRKFELVEPFVYSVTNYNEAEAILGQWATLAQDAQAVYDSLDEVSRPAFFEMILHPVLGGYTLHKIQIGAARNTVFANQHRNQANVEIRQVLTAMSEDANLTARWDSLLGGKWARLMDQTHFGYDGYWQQPMRNVAPAMQYVQESVGSTAGAIGIAIEGLNASTPGDDKYHANSGTTLTLPPLDPYGPASRWFDVYSRGVISCDWSAKSNISWVKLSRSSGVVGPQNGTDSRVYLSVDWTNAPKVANTSYAAINFTTSCGRRGFARWYRAPLVVLPVTWRTVATNFTVGFVESDGQVSIEGPNYQRIYRPTNSSSGGGGANVTYHTVKNLGRTYGGVSLWPQSTLTLAPEAAPALEYDLYLFTKTSAANVTLYLSPSLNYLSDRDPLRFAVSLYPAGSAQATPKLVRFVGDSGADMPANWGGAVADAVWGHQVGHNTTTTWAVAGPGAFKLRVYALAPSIVVQKLVVDLGGLRPSYLGPPESFLVSRDWQGQYDGTSFAKQATVLGPL